MMLLCAQRHTSTDCSRVGELIGSSFSRLVLGLRPTQPRRVRFTAEADIRQRGVGLVRATVCDSAVMFSQRSPRNARAVFSALWHSIKVCIQYNTESITRECHA
jgi:hypothetical protein